MQTRECFRFAEYRDRDRNEELIGVLTAISIVSKRLAGRLIALEGHYLHDMRATYEQTPWRLQAPARSTGRSTGRAINRRSLVCWRERRVFIRDLSGDSAYPIQCVRPAGGSPGGRTPRRRDRG